MLRRTLFYLITIFVFSAPAVGSEKKISLWPYWMVKIEKRNPEITATGYVVRLNSHLYVRTASHVTLGSLADVTLTDFEGRRVDFNAAQSATNNQDDDQLIALADSTKLQPLAIYAPALKVFLVLRDAYFDYLKNTRSVELEPGAAKETVYAADAIISPPWIKRKNFKFQWPVENPDLKVSERDWDQGYYHLRSAMNGSYLIADMKLIPGESGSPVMGWIKPSLESEDMSFSIRLENAYTEGGFRDDSGQTIDAAYVPGRNAAFILKGHATALHHDFNVSMFLKQNAYEKLQNNLSSFLGTDVGHTQWVQSHNLTYRTYTNSSNRVTEIFDTALPTGDGTAADGGDGTAADGGDGTAADGGGTQNFFKRLQIGITIDGQQVIAFKLKPFAQSLSLVGMDYLNDYFTNESYITANWPSFVLLNTLQKINSEKIYEVVTLNNLRNYFLDRFKHATTSVEMVKKQSACVVDADLLTQNILSVDINIPTSKTLHFERRFEEIKNLETIQVSKSEIYQVDLNKLWGTDTRFTGIAFSPEENRRPSIEIVNGNFFSSKYPCVLFQKN